MKRVLIVDDAAFARLSLKTILEKYGFEVVGEASNGISAIKLYKELMPDVVTMDITMPELDGVETIKIIKSMDKDARVIVVSALGHEYKVKEAILAGAVAFIVKPFKDDFIVQSLAKL